MSEVKPLFIQEEEILSIEGIGSRDKLQELSLQSTPIKNKENQKGLVNDSFLVKNILLQISEFPSDSNFENLKLARNCNFALNKLNDMTKKVLSGMKSEFNVKSIEIDKIKEENEKNLNDQYTQFSHLLIENRSQNATLEQELSRLKFELIENSKFIESYDKHLKEKESEIENLQNKKLLLAKTIDDLHDHIVSLEKIRVHNESIYQDQMAKIEILHQKIIEIQTRSSFLEYENTILKNSLEEKESLLQENYLLIKNLHSNLEEKEIEIKIMGNEVFSLKEKVSAFNEMKLSEELIGIKELIENKGKISASSPSKDETKYLLINQIKDIREMVSQTKENNTRYKHKILNFEKILFLLHKMLLWHQEELNLRGNQISFLKIQLFATQEREFQEKKVLTEKFKFETEKYLSVIQTKFFQNLLTNNDSSAEKLGKLEGKLSEVKNQLSLQFETLKERKSKEQKKSNNFRSSFRKAIKNLNWTMNITCLLLKRFIEVNLEDLQNPIAQNYFMIAKPLQVKKNEGIDFNKLSNQELISLQTFFTEMRS